MSFITPTLTPRAAEAIIAWITRRGDTDGTFYASINGVEHEFEARFDVEWEREPRFSDTHSSGYGHDDLATCSLIGAWAFDEDGNTAFAGNRAEVAALLGEPTVCQWEETQAEREMGL